MGLTSSQDKNVNKKKYLFSEEHHDQYLTAINMFKDKPILGVGIKMFRERCDDVEYSYGNYGCTTHPHNSYLQLLSETGFLGSLFYFIFLYYFQFIYLNIL